MKYRMYVDEVGNADLESSDNPNHRFLSLTGVILDLGYVTRALQPQLNQLKVDVLKADPDELDLMVLHRKEIVNASDPFRILIDPAVRAEFDERILALLGGWEYTVISVCLDKKSHKERYRVWRYEPYHYCLKLLLERFVFVLQGEECRGDVMAESRGGKEDRRLKDSFSRLWRNGTDQVAASSFQHRLTSRQLKVKKKEKNIAGLQLADLIAHPSRNEILEEEGLLRSRLGSFAKKVIPLLQKKYHQRDGEIRGAGKKFIG